MPYGQRLKRRFFSTVFQRNRLIMKSLKDWGCYQSQNYKIWKQFTTLSIEPILTLRLLSIAKLQNLKAIHNRFCLSLKNSVVVINHKTTKFESNSQHPLYHCFQRKSCYQSQNYKIWKQFTTPFLMVAVATLLSITKLQNLKAIYNPCSSIMLASIVVINHKTTKFESNSQQYFCQVKMTNCCYQSQNYKIWKQFTTTSFKGKKFSVLLSITKLQNLKAIHNSVEVECGV